MSDTHHQKNTPKNTRYVGVILIGIGLACGVFALYLFIKRGENMISPVPETHDVKVIYITPGSN